MSRFFNRIRQNLLAQSRFTRYLIYAVGEIVLVVIGILIALQINDWSAQQKLDLTNVRLMERMQDELSINIDRLHYLDTIYASKSVQRGWKPTLGRVDTAWQYITEGLNDDRMVWLLEAGDLHDASMYNLSTAAYREMLNSGRFYSLGPDSLMKRIQLYYQLLDREEQYAVQWNEEASTAWKECKYGFNDLCLDYQLNGLAALLYHPWYLNPRSREYIDLKSAIFISLNTTERNRRHAHRIIQYSDTLIQLLQKEIHSNR